MSEPNVSPAVLCCYLIHSASFATTPLSILPAESRRTNTHSTAHDFSNNDTYCPPPSASRRGANMGRRPNAVVNEFFLRGEKLDDNSNRYQHTCKKCGEHVRRGDANGRY